MTRIDGYQAMVVSDRDLANKQQKLWEIIYDTQVIVLENFQFQPVTASGGIHTGAEGLHASYLEAREAEEFVSVVEQDCVVYDSIRDNILRKYDYSVQAENRILSALQTGNAELAIAFIDKLLERNFAPNGATSNMRRCLLGDIYCTLLKAADEKGCIERIEVSYNSFGIEQPLDELRAKYALVVRSICQDTQPRAEISSDKELCLRIMDYIRENYADPKLNISQTALQFRMSPTALSTMFKSEMGKSLLKAINEVRAEHATEFLRQGFSVSETAEKVGITESSSFIRLYRKEMGITPGQMKTHLKNENT
jgi:AraC-like DNA-binding protein